MRRWPFHSRYEARTRSATSSRSPSAALKLRSMRSRSGRGERRRQLARRGRRPTRPCRPPTGAGAGARRPRTSATHHGPRAAWSSASGSRSSTPLRLGAPQEVEHLVLLVGERPLEPPAELLVDRLEHGVALGERSGGVVRDCRRPRPSASVGLGRLRLRLRPRAPTSPPVRVPRRGIRAWPLGPQPANRSSAGEARLRGLAVVARRSASSAGGSSVFGLGPSSGLGLGLAGVRRADVSLGRGRRRLVVRRAPRAGRGGGRPRPRPGARPW